MQENILLRKTAVLALTVSVLLLVVKFFAYFLTGSKAILSDAVESIVNVATGAFLVFSITLSSEPVDASHPYGHGKVESFSAGLEGGLILLAGVMIMVESLPAFFTPIVPQKIGLGLILVSAAGLVNFALGFYLLRTGKTHRSEALQADGHHLMTDFYTSGGVILGLITVRVTGWGWLDPLIACLVAVNILVPGARLFLNAVKNLMNEADPAILLGVLAALREVKTPAPLCPHQLRVIRSGRYYHIDLHIILPSQWPLAQVHETEKGIARQILESMGEEGDVMIHVDPCEENCCCSCCRVETCTERTTPFLKATTLTLESVTARHPACPRKGKGLRTEGKG